MIGIDELALFRDVFLSIFCIIIYKIYIEYLILFYREQKCINWFYDHEDDIDDQLESELNLLGIDTLSDLEEE